MAGIKLYGSTIAPPVMRALAALYEKEVHFDFVPLNIGASEHKSEAYLSINPFGKVPALEDGDLKLFESRAITQYITHTYADKGTQLIYQDPKKMAIISVWMEVEAHQFDPAASKLTGELGIKPLFKFVTDDAVVEEYEAKLDKVLDVYEARLTHSKYLGGESFSLADLHHLPNLKYLFGTQVKKLFDSRPHVSSWCAEIMSRPAWLKVIAMCKLRK